VITRELLSSQKHFEMILGSMSEGILELTSDGRVVYANAASISLLGMEEEKLLASDFTELFHESCRQRVSQALERPDSLLHAISEDAPVALNGKQISVKVLPINDEGQGAAIVILTDVSLKRRMEAQLRHTQKMEAIGTLAGGIAHDFNNLLMGIQGNASLMLLGIDSGHPHYTRLKGIEKAVKSSAELTKQLLGFARGGKYEVRITDVNELLKESTKIFVRTKKEITIHTNYIADIWPVEVDQGQIQQVLVNLLVNACQAMPGGGDVYLKTETVVLKEIDAKPYQLDPGNYVKLAITDTGVGMGEATRQRIFDPFFTTKEMGRGTGLGLASAYGIVKNHGGAITVHSDIGKGSTFAVYLPAADRDAETVPEPPDEIKEGSGTLLLVDDEQAVLEVGRGMLEALGYEVLTAEGGREALTIYRKNRETIDLVILDMIMPKISGGETYDRLRKLEPGVKVLLSSGYALDGQASEILNRGCRGFIQKPFNLNRLGQKIREILDPKG